VDQGADRLPAHDAQQVAGAGHVVDAHRHAVVAAQGDGGGIHYRQLVFDDLVVGEVLVARGGLVLGRVGTVHAVDLGGLQQQVRADLDGAQGGGRIGGEERIAGAGGEQGEAALLALTYGAAPEEVLGRAVGGNGPHHAPTAARLSE